MQEKMQDLGFWEKERFRNRSIKIQFGRKIDIIPVPDDVIVCDFCNAEITEFPVPVYLGNALCQRCFREIKEDIKNEKKMSAELKCQNRWFRALEIAECLFEDEGYHTEYLQDLKAFVKEKQMYSPKIKEDLMVELYQQAKVEGIPMTKLVDKILRDALNRGNNKKKEERNESKK